MAAVQGLLSCQHTCRTSECGAGGAARCCHAWVSYVCVCLPKCICELACIGCFIGSCLRALVASEHRVMLACIGCFIGSCLRALVASWGHACVHWLLHRVMLACIGCFTDRAMLAKQLVVAVIHEYVSNPAQALNTCFLTMTVSYHGCDRDYCKDDSCDNDHYLKRAQLQHWNVLLQFRFLGMLIGQARCCPCQRYGAKLGPSRICFLISPCSSPDGYCDPSSHWLREAPYARQC
jgi:hypothetical protein